MALRAMVAGGESLAWLKLRVCCPYAIGNHSSTRLSVTSASGLPSRIASTISSASSVSLRTRVMQDGAIPSRSASSTMVANSSDSSVRFEGKGGSAHGLELVPVR